MKRIARLFLLFMIMATATAVRSEVLQEIVVKEGDTLWGVANYYLKDPRRWPEILKYNNLPSADINVILPGMRLRVPVLLIKEHLRAAYLIYVLNDVLYRRNSQAEWKKAHTDMELFNEDGLRTLTQSRAKVRFSSGELLYVDENSLIILKPEKKREEIDLLAGGVRASRTKILANTTMISPQIEPRGPNPDFRTKVKEDKTTLVEVYEGIVDVTAQGKTVTLTKGFGTEVKFQQTPSLPTALPPAPDMNVQSPTSMPGTKLAASGKISSGSLELHIKPAAISPSKTGSSRTSEKRAPQSQVLEHIISKYHLQISTGHAFSTVVIDEIKPIGEKADIDFKKNRLPDGIYFYRIAYMDELGFEGQYSSPVQFVIDTTPPVLEVSSPQNESETDEEFVHVEGKTEPGAVLKVNDKLVKLEDDGKFITALIPKMGRNPVALEAEDRAGNRTAKELTVIKVKTAVKKKGSSVSGALREKSPSFASVALGTLTGIVIVGVLFLIVK